MVSVTGTTPDPVDVIPPVSVAVTLIVFEPVLGGVTDTVAHHVPAMFASACVEEPPSGERSADTAETAFVPAVTGTETVIGVAQLAGTLEGAMLTVPTDGGVTTDTPPDPEDVNPSASVAVTLIVFDPVLEGDTDTVALHVPALFESACVDEPPRGDRSADTEETAFVPAVTGTEIVTEVARSAATLEGVMLTVPTVGGVTTETLPDPVDVNPPASVAVTLIVLDPALEGVTETVALHVPALFVSACVDEPPRGERSADTEETAFVPALTGTEIVMDVVELRKIDAGVTLTVPMEGGMMSEKVPVPVLVTLAESIAVTVSVFVPPVADDTANVPEYTKEPFPSGVVLVRVAVADPPSALRSTVTLASAFAACVTPAETVMDPPAETDCGDMETVFTTGFRFA